MKETLTCATCKGTWKREKSRGRKPTTCPKCIKAIEKAALKAEKEKTIKVKSSKKEELVVESQVEPEVVHTKSQVSIYDVYRNIYPKPANYNEFFESTKNGSEWICKSCKKTYHSHVALVVPPTHRCPPKSSNVKEYERVS